MTVHLFRVGKVWHYRFQIDGSRKQRSTRETDRQRAEQVADQALRQAKLWARESKELPTLRELVGQWLLIHHPTASRAHVKVVETFGRLHLYDLADVLIDELSTDRVEGERTGIRTAVRLMLGLGLRESETITARWEWLDIGRQTYTPGRTKGREADPLPVPVPDGGLEASRPYPPESERTPLPGRLHPVGNAGHQPGSRSTPHHGSPPAWHVRHPAQRGRCSGAVDPACVAPQEPDDDSSLSRGRHAHGGRRPATHRGEDRLRITHQNQWRASGEPRPANPAVTRNHDPKW